jgi:hypothetical protein
VESPIVKDEPYPKADWMDIRSDPELNKVIQIESYEKAMLILLWRILKELKKK